MKKVRFEDTSNDNYMTEYQPEPEPESETIVDGMLESVDAVPATPSPEDESRRGFLGSALALGLGIVGVSSPKDAEAGVLKSAAKVAALRAAANSAEKRLSGGEKDARLKELENAAESAGRECNAEFNKYMKLNAGKSEKDFLKTQVGIDCYARWGETLKNLSDFKK